MKKQNKYEYTSVIQQDYGQGYEDVSEYEANSAMQATEKYKDSNGIEHKHTLLWHDLQEYKLLGYPTRVIGRRTLIQPEIAQP